MKTAAAVPPGEFAASAFGCRWRSDLPLRLFASATGPNPAGVISVGRCDYLPPRAALSTHGRGFIAADGFRFVWEDEVTFDFHAPGRVDYLPGPGWRGALPDCFFSTVTALVLAWNGLVPLHASAVELEDKAWLFAGRAGAGKSTIVAETLAAGGRLIGDDLTALQYSETRGFTVMPGRTAMRLHPDTAALLHGAAIEPAPDDPRGKLLVTPAERCTTEGLPLGGVFLVGMPEEPVSPAEAVTLLPQHLFRPRWLQDVPGQGLRRAALIALAGQVPIAGVAAARDFSAAARALRQQAIRALI